MPLFIKTEKFTQNTLSLSPEKRRKYLLEHKSWVNSLSNKGFIICSGYLRNHQRQPGGGGILFLEAESYQEAENLIKDDPMIKNNLVNWELNEWVPVVRNIMKIINEETYP